MLLQAFLVKTQDMAVSHSRHFGLLRVDVPEISGVLITGCTSACCLLGSGPEQVKARAKVQGQSSSDCKQYPIISTDNPSDQDGFDSQCQQ